MEDAATMKIPFSGKATQNHRLPVVVVEPTITGALESIKAYDIEVQVTICFWAFVAIDHPPIEFK